MATHRCDSSGQILNLATTFGRTLFKSALGCGIFKAPLYVQFVIPLSRDAEPLSRQIYLWFRQAILQGSVSSRERLPSTRDMAEQLRVSRTVVVLAYEQLLAEGFIRARGGSGTYVSEGLGRESATHWQNTGPGAAITLRILGGGGIDESAVFRARDRPLYATISPTDAVTSKFFHSRCGAACCCGMQGERRFVSLTTGLRREALPFATPFLSICDGLALWFAIRRK